MSGTMLVRDAAKLWNLTERRVTGLCKEGKIAGAKKQGRSWLIPADAQKPEDSRVKSGTYKKCIDEKKLPLPIGVSDYRRACSEYYYVDKTLMIKELIDTKSVVSLFTRPRRFGKTLNMNMLRTFFEKTEEDTSVYFQDKKIWACGEAYRSYQGKYPVIFLTFKDVKRTSWENTLVYLEMLITSEYRRHKELADSTRITDKTYYQQMVEGNADREMLDTALYRLSKMLHEHYGVAPILIIDEYDTPIQQGHMRGYYDEVILFMRNMFSSVLKDNVHLSYGFLTGILRVAKESIFSGMNNLRINSVLDNRFSDYFGFTFEEIEAMLEYYEAEDRFDEICAWYDGYIFGNAEIFNPWSVINYFSNDCLAEAYWVETGSNEIIGEVLTEVDQDLYDLLTSLMNGNSIETRIDTNVIYPQIRNNPSSIFSFLLVTGYLKVTKKSLSFGGEYVCEVALPNKEIAYAYHKEILLRFGNIIPQSTSIAIQSSLIKGDGARFKAMMEKLLMQSVSYYDTAGESFYHGLMLGVCALLGGAYVTSNRESGDGRYDIQLMPEYDHLPGVLIELKAEKACSQEKLKELAGAALQQINEKGYETELKAKGVHEIFKYGVAFSGKNVEIAVE
jgi:hypothetical protein